MDPQTQTRGKRRRRILLVAAVLLMMGTVGGGLYAWQHQRHLAHLDTLKPRGLEHLEAGEYTEAVHRLGVYLNRHPEDLEALRALAEARRHVHDAGGAHLRQTIDILRRILRHEPGDEATQRELLELYVAVGQNTEAVSLAEELLERHPEDADVLRQKALALAEMRRHDRAREVAERYTELHPADTEIQSLIVRLMHAEGAPGREILGRARALVEAHREDGRYLMVLGFAHQVLGERDMARGLYHDAAERMLADSEAAEDVDRLARRMDEVGLWREATELIERAERDIDDPELMGLLLRRLWELGRHDQLRAQGESLDPQDPRTATQSLAVFALARLQAAQRDKGRTLIDALAGRRRDGLAQAWASVLEVLADEEADAARLAEVCSAALLRYPDYPYFHYYHGQGLAGDGQRERAIEAWTRAGQRSPVWAAPLLRVARMFLETHRPGLAIEAARAARQRVPGRLEPVLMMLEAYAANLDQLSDEQLERYGQSVEEVVDEVPDTRRRLLPLLAEVHARRGDTERAGELVQEGLALEPPVSERVALQLAEVSERHGLGLVEACLEAAEQAHGMGPRLAFSRASWEARALDDTDAALATFERAAERAEPETDAAERSWALARVRLLERLEPEAAVEQWRELIEQRAEDRRLLEAAVESEALWRDPAAIGRAISALGELTDERGTSWRVARARQLMRDGGERALAEASLLLLEVTREAEFLLEPRLLLARCFRAMDRPERALEVLERAQRIAPDAASVALDRAAVLHELGRDEELARLLEALRDREDLNPSQQLELASLLIRGGDADGAERRLDAVLRADPGHRQGQRLLAQLYAHQGRLDEAEALYDRMLEDPDATAVTAAARFYERRGRPERARALYERLGEFELAEDRRAMLRAGFHHRQGEPEQARAVLAGAATAEARPALWHHWIVLEFGADEVEGALDAAADAAAAHPDHEGFAALVRYREHVERVAGEPLLRELAVSLLGDASHREAAAEALELVVEAEGAERPTREVARELRRIADRAPSLMALQRLTVRLHQMVDRADEAADVAVRAMRARSESPQAAQLAAEALSAAGRWGEVVEAAEELRRRAPAQAREAALLTAEARLRQGDGARAAEALRPHLAGAAAADDAGADADADDADADDADAGTLSIHRAYARALIQDDRAGAARELLEPRLEASAAHRSLAMDLAVFNLDDAGTAADWLAAIASRVPEGATDERMALARAWRALDERYGLEEHTPQALGLLESITDRDEAPAAAFEMLGMIHDAHGRTDEAESAYRAAIDRDPDRGISQNNLAVILRERGEHAEALRLAERAAEAEPSRAAFQNTLAMTRLANDRPEAALEAARRAIALEPGRIEWYLGFGETLIEAEELEEARELLGWLEERVAAGAELSADMRSRLESLRETLETAGALLEEGEAVEPHAGL